MDFELTDHARTRLQQRGATYAGVRIVFEFGELIRDVGGQCVEVALKREQLEDLVAFGVSRTEAEKLHQLRLVLSPEGRVVTLLKNDQFKRRSNRRRYSSRQRAMRAALHARGHRNAR
ncbi:MAG: hypothetical protein LCH95_18170 [Proteobacteria bacterium]|nr:hypothetical protein [Pseudomonadota bacterium]